MNFTITPESISNAGTIVLYVVSIGISDIPEHERVIEDIEELNRIEEYSDSNKAALQPTFE